MDTTPISSAIRNYSSSEDFDMKIVGAARPAAFLTTLAAVFVLLTTTLAGPASAATYDPDTGPDVRTIDDQPYTMPSCYEEYACVKVPLSDASNPRTREFLFTAQGDYGVQDWHGSGLVNNRQINGWTVTLLDQNRNKLWCLPMGWKGTVPLEPVWWVRITWRTCKQQ